MNTRSCRILSTLLAFAVLFAVLPITATTPQSIGVDATQPFATFVAVCAGYGQMMPFAALANQIRQSEAGDPLYGTVIPNSTLNWNDATQVQQLIVVWYGASNTNLPRDFTGVLKANAGPNVPWNWSYSKWASFFKGQAKIAAATAGQ